MASIERGSGPRCGAAKMPRNTYPSRSHRCGPTRLMLCSYARTRVPKGFGRASMRVFPMHISSVLQQRSRRLRRGASTRCSALTSTKRAPWVSRGGARHRTLCEHSEDSCRWVRVSSLQGMCVVY